ncbi:MAG: hypothetical protein ABW119_13050 [Candidatus Thiodiazotropha lotti]
MDRFSQSLRNKILDLYLFPSLAQLH